MDYIYYFINNIQFNIKKLKGHIMMYLLNRQHM